MFCPGCGTENPAEASFCLKCGSMLPRFVAGQGFAAPAQPAAGAPAPSAFMSYAWGYVHGWAMLVGSPLFFLLFLAVLVDSKSDSETRLGAVILMLLLAFGAITGLGLVRKAKWGMILVFVWAGLHLLFMGLCLLALAAEPKEPSVPIVLLFVLAGLAFWGVSSAYYYRRRSMLR